MDSIFMNSENSKISDTHTLSLNLSDKIDLKRSDKYVALSNLSIYYKWENIKKTYKGDKFKISAPRWNKKFELPDGSYFVSGVQDHFDYVIKKCETVTNNPLIRTYMNKIENRTTFKI